MCSLACVKAKTKEKPEKIFLKLFLLSKTVLHFLENKKKYLKTFYFKFYFLRLFFYVLERFKQIFKKILIFEASDFLKIKSLPHVQRKGAQPKLPIFLN